LSQQTFSPGQIIVKFRSVAPKAVDTRLQDLAHRFRVQSTEPLLVRKGVLSKPVASLGQIYMVRMPPDQDVLVAANAYSQHPLVEYAQPNHLFHPFTEPDDSRYSDQDNLSLINWQILWEGVGSVRETIIIGVIDSGVDYTHQDLAANIWINQAENDGIAGIDDDQNGYVDDIRGWDFGDAPNLPGKGDYLARDNDPMDESGHGTRVAGIAGAVVDNLTGIAGAGIDAKIMSLRGGITLQSNQTFLEEDDLAAAILYAVDNGARVINMSWGARENAKLIRDAIRYAASRDVVLISSAGNSGQDGLSYPAALDETIAVGATDRYDRKAGFSSIGVPLDLVAPGAGILSTFPGDLYLRGSGTSFSSPLIAGLSALLLSRRPDLTPEQVRTTLIRSTVDTGHPGWDPSHGAGRIDCRLLLQFIQSPLDLPYFSILSPSTGSGAASEFTVLADLSGTSLSAFRISWGLGLDPLNWHTIHTGDTKQVTEFTWDVTSVADSVAILRMEADFNGDRTQEDRVRVSVRKLSTPIIDPSFETILVDNKLTYQASWSTPEPAEGFLLVRSLSNSRMDTLSSGLLDVRQTIVLPTSLSPGEYGYRLGSRGPGGLEHLTDEEEFTFGPLHLSQDGLIELADLPEAFLADMTVDLDQNGRMEIAAMPRIENQNYSPVELYERLNASTYTSVFRSSDSYLPWTFGDGDNDGDTDLLGVNVISGTAHLRLFTNTDSNPYPVMQVLDQEGTSGGEILDLDGDGKNEIIANPVWRKGMQVFRGDQTGFTEVSFLDNPTPGSNTPGSRFLVADLDNDGRSDILGGDNDGDLWTFQADETGEFLQSWLQIGDDDTDASWLGGGVDLDEDGNVEFIVARTVVDDNAALNGYWIVEVYSATDVGEFFQEWSIRISGVIESGNGISIGDLDADGRPDFAICARPDIYIFRSDAPDTYRPVWHGITGLTDRPLISDLDNDGLIEMLFNREDKLLTFQSNLPDYSRPRPQLLLARPLSPDAVHLSWSETPGTTSYEIWRGVGGDSLRSLAGELSATSYTDTTVSEGQIYSYRVSAATESAGRIESSTVFVRPNPAPELLSLTHLGPDQIALTFNEPMGESADNADAFSVSPDLGKASSAIRDHHGYRVVLTFDDRFPPEIALALNISSLTDTSGVPLSARFNPLPFTQNRPTYPSSALADFNEDGSVTFSDFILFVQAYGSSNARFDLDTDGKVGFGDFIIFANLYGK
tara:strand:- start:4033 stop:7704 length:3672 start_codon:yes stop_codon:yes gene_type:complete